MGFILDLAADAAPFNAETRRESFYIGARHPMDNNTVLEARRDGGPVVRGAVSVPAVQIPAFLAALNEVRVSRAYLDWADGIDLRRDGINPDSEPVEWTVTRQDDRLVGAGRVIAYGSEGDWVPAQSIELCYRDLADLIQQLATTRA